MTGKAVPRSHQQQCTLLRSCIDRSEMSTRALSSTGVSSKACCSRRAGNMLMFTHVDDDEVDALEDDDDTDRLPHILVVRRVDIAFMAVSLVGYVLDMLTDLYTAHHHYTSGRESIALLILVFALVPSLVLNLLSVVWLYRRHSTPTRTAIRVVFAVLQLAPVLCHLETLYYAVLVYASGSASPHATVAEHRRPSNVRRRHRRLFVNMLRTDRDSTLLRLFEAFLEAAPQSLIQTSALASQGVLTIAHWPVIGSAVVSMLSLAWALVAQHRSLRLARADKANIDGCGMVSMFLWRVLSLAARLPLLAALLVAVPLRWSLSACLAHYLLSAAHLLMYQRVSVGNVVLEALVIALGAWVCLFTPFNMAEGDTLHRYGLAYALEFVEHVAIVVFLYDDSLVPLVVTSFTCYILGLSAMTFYYRACHPTKGDARLCHRPVTKSSTQLSELKG